MAKAGRPRIHPIRIDPIWGEVWDSGGAMKRHCPNCSDNQAFRKKAANWKCYSCGTISGTLGV